MNIFYEFLILIAILAVAYRFMWWLTSDLRKTFDGSDFDES